MKYNAATNPDSRIWLELDEFERIDAVISFHNRIKFHCESLKAHAIFHCVIENQLAEGLSSVVAAFKRLQEEGLDRHETIHAIGSVLSGQMHEIVSKNVKFDQKDYDDALLSMTAAKWQESAE